MNKCILQVCGYAAPYPGNFIETLCCLAKQNKVQGYDTIFAFPDSAEKIDWCIELKQEYKVYFLPLSRARITPLTYIEMKKIYKENNICIIHSHFELYDMPATLCAPKNVKVFWHLHDSLDLIYQKSNFLYRVLWKYQYKYAGKRATLLAVSEKGKRFAIQLGFSSNRAHFLPNGIDTDRIDKATEGEYPNYDFLIYGWDFKRKGVDVLLDALTDMKEDFSCALVAGDDSWQQIKQEKYKQLINQPSVADVAALYRATKCFLHISRQEGLSYALLEAIYSGCIVICSDIEQNMFAKDFPTVRFVKVGDVEELRSEMRQVLDSSIVLTEEAIDESRRKIMEEYSLNTWVKRVQEYYFV